MGMDTNLLQSFEKGLTSAFLPDLLNTVACPPTTTMFAWESNWVVVSWPSFAPPSAVVAQTAETMPSTCLFGPAWSPPQVDGHVLWRAIAGSQPDFPALDPMERNFSMSAVAHRSVEDSSSCPLVLATFAAEILVRLVVLVSEMC